MGGIVKEIVIVQRFPVILKRDALRKLQVNVGIKLKSRLDSDFTNLRRQNGVNF